VGSFHSFSSSVTQIDRFLTSSEVDDLMMRAFGSSLVPDDFDGGDNVWSDYWESISQLSGRHYDLPRGTCGRRFIDLLCVEIRHLTRGNYPSDRLIVFSSVILQRDKSVRFGPDIRRTLNRRMSMWENDKFDLLVQETVRCERSFTNQSRHRANNENHIINVFTRLMLQGKVRAAVRWLTERSKGHVLRPTEQIKMIIDGQEKSISVIEALKLKHPAPKPPHSSTLSMPDHLPQLEDLDITGDHVHHIALRIQGSAGPGGCDSKHWQDILLRFGAIASETDLSRLLSNPIFDWSLLRALLAGRLIALDKSPGLRPIGVGETLRRVICKVICLVTRDDAEEVCGSVQLCSGVRCGIEGAIHATADLFHSNDYGILTMDAHNAFNSINRTSLLWNIRVLWPRASRFIFNTYRGWSPLIVRGSNSTIFSREGVVQCDPLSMFSYAIATIPLIRELEDAILWRQLWFADDSSVIGNIDSIRIWFNKLISIGPLYGYYPEPSKSSSNC
jgi:hypothetical protein